MRILVIALILLALLYAGRLYFKGPEIQHQASRAELEAEAEANREKKDFGGIITVLERDMAGIPANLTSGRVVPQNAFDLKSRLEGMVDQHEEYRIVVQACDLIIYADQQRSVLQGQLPVDEARAGTEPGRAAVRTRANSQWTSYRQQTDAEVKRLLALLKGRKL